ncbi:MAG: PilN domain-containing protein [Bacillota bacterium]|jgi:Tfp pilus assembly protein PilN
MQMQVNLLPAQYRPKPQVRLWPIALTIALMLNLIIISTYWLTLQLDLSATRASVQSLENNIANLQRRIDDVQWKADLKAAVAQKSDYISGQVLGSVLWSPALDVIEDSLIPGVVINSISFSGDGSISITATVDSIKTAVDYWASVQTKTGLEGIWLSNAPAEGGISISMTGWYGREVEEVEE